MLEKDCAEFKRIAEKLAGVALVDANPENWASAGAKPVDMSEDQRGDAYWCRKLAGQTLSVLTKVMYVTGMMERAMQGGNILDDPNAEDRKTLDKEIDAARRKATRMLKLVSSRPNVSA